MGVNSDIPAKPFQAPPPTQGVPSSGIMSGQNNNIRGMANSAAQNVANRQQRFMDLVRSTSTNNGNYDAEIHDLVKKQTVVDDDYIKVGSLFVDRRDEIDSFIDRVLFG